MHKRINWGSRLGFILVGAGATIGFGNIWRFPYLVGQNGGGAFLLVFLLCVLIMGVPLIIAEMVIGRKAATNVIDAFKIDKKSKWWQLVGIGAILGAFGILSYYVVLAGWVIGYIGFIGSGYLPIDIAYQMGNYASFFQGFIKMSYLPLFFTIVFLLMNYFVLAFDITKGMEKFSSRLMPILFIIMIIMIARSLSLEGAWGGVKFYLMPDFSKITFKAVLAALGQTFFSLSIGFGVLITLASYLDRQTSIASSAMWVAILDTLVAVLAGLIIFPAIFAFGLDPAAGTALIFNVLPVVFSQMFMGQIFAILFFFILLIAALTSSITIFEVMITALIEKTKLSRKAATILSITGVFILGAVPSSLGYGVWQSVKILGMSIFDAFDYVSGNILFVLTALFSTVFIGYVLKEDAIKELLMDKQTKLVPFWAKLWLYAIKYIIPLIIIVIFIKGV